MMGKDVVVVYSLMLLQYLYGENGENHKKISDERVKFPPKDLNRPEHETNIQT
jgi:hypothetical protein